MYGDPFDNTPEVIELCLNCKHSDCIGHHGCRERIEIVRRLRAAALGKVNEKTRFRLDEKYTIGSETMTGREWAEKYKRSWTTVYTRVLAGYSVEEALTIETLPRKGKKGFSYVVGGVKRTGKEWEKLLGMRPGYVAKRANRKNITGEEVIRRWISTHKGCDCGIKEADKSAE